jgi:hypothetical protein
MKRILLMCFVVAFAFAALSGCASTGTDSATKPAPTGAGPEGLMGPQGEGGWQNPNM